MNSTGILLTAPVNDHCPKTSMRREPGNQLFIQSFDSHCSTLGTKLATLVSGCNFDNQKYTVLNF